MGHRRHSAIAVSSMLQGHTVLNPPPSVGLSHLPEAPSPISTAFTGMASPMDGWGGLVGGAPAPERHI